MASKSPPRDLMDRQTSVSQWYSDDVPAAEKTNRSMGRVMSMGRDTAMRCIWLHSNKEQKGQIKSLPMSNSILKWLSLGRACGLPVMGREANLYLQVLQSYYVPLIVLFECGS
eukprot:5710769-Amphidinium_carterae.1